MPTLRDCIKKSGKLISPAEAKRLLDAHEQAVTDGYDAERAAHSAIDSFTDELGSHIKAITAATEKIRGPAKPTEEPTDANPKPSAVEIASDETSGTPAPLAEGSSPEVQQPPAARGEGEIPLEAPADVRADVEPEGTGIKNTSVAQMRVDMGRAPTTPREGATTKEMHAEAIARVEADPDAGAKLVAELSESPRQVTGPEAVLLSHEITRIDQKMKTAVSDLERATESGDEAAAELARQARDAAQEEFDRTEAAAGKAKTKWSDVGRALQATLKEDYSLGNLTRQLKISRGPDRPLTEEDHAKLKQAHADYERLKEDYDKKLAASESARSGEAQKRAEAEANVALLKIGNDLVRERRPPPSRRPVLDALIDRGEQAKQRILAKMKSGQTRSSLTLGLEDAGEYAQVIAGWIAKGIRNGSQLTARLIKEFGEEIRPHIPQLLKLGTDEHQRSMKALASTGRDTVIERAATVDQMKQRMTGGQQITELGGLVRNVIDQHLAEGVKRRDLTDAVHNTLQQVDPSVTREQTIEAIQDAERTGRAMKRLDSQINQINAELRAESVFSGGTRRPIQATEVTSKRATLKDLKLQRDYLREQIQPEFFADEKNRRELSRVSKETKAIKEKIAREDFSKRPKPAPFPFNNDVLEAKTRLETQKEKFEAGRHAEELRSRTNLQKFGDSVKEALNLPRSVLSSWDLSAVLRQGGFISVANPLRAAQSIAPMLRSLRNDFQAKKVQQEILSRPNAPEYKSSKLYLAPLDAEAPLSSQEEQIMSKLARNIPGVRASNRAFVTYLNKLRADSFDQMRDALVGGDKEPSKEELAAISNYINVATGRGALGVKTAQAAETLASVFFSPRLAASRFQLLFGQPLAKGTPRTRAQVAKEYAKFALGLSAIYGIGALAGGKMEDDPRSSDFGKIRFGNTRIDPLIGMSQVAALLSRLVSGSKKNAAGKIVPLRDTHRYPEVSKDPKTGKPMTVPYGGQSEPDVMASFVRSKLSPVVGAAVDTVSGKDFAGQPVMPAQTAANLVTPLPFDGMGAIYKEHGAAGGSVIEMLNLLGMGTQNYQPAKKKALPPK